MTYRDDEFAELFPVRVSHPLSNGIRIQTAMPNTDIVALENIEYNLNNRSTKHLLWQ
jgi:hypothetical protein